MDVANWAIRSQADCMYIYIYVHSYTYSYIDANVVSDVCAWNFNWNLLKCVKLIKT